MKTDKNPVFGLDNSTIVLLGKTPAPSRITEIADEVLSRLGMERRKPKPIADIATGVWTSCAMAPFVDAAHDAALSEYASRAIDAIHEDALREHAALAEKAERTKMDALIAKIRARPVKSRPSVSPEDMRAREEARLERHYRRCYGIGLQEYLDMLEAQGGRCSACPCEPPDNGRLFVDHDHATGAVRGLLCASCNVTLGRYGDSQESMRSKIELLQSLISYLDRHGAENKNG